MPKGKCTTPEEQQQILKMYTVDKMSQAKIAKAVGLTPSGVALILHRHGIRSRNYGGLGGNRKYNLTDEQSNLMVEMYESGKSCEAISKVVGVPWLLVNRRLKEFGVQLRPGGFRKGSEHHCWTGGRSRTQGGYIQVLISEDDPLYCMAQKKNGPGTHRYALEHRIVMARHLGRPLTRAETVHHIDDDKANNSIDNLQLRRGKHGKGAAFVCADCGSNNITSVPLPN